MNINLINASIEEYCYKDDTPMLHKSEVIDYRHGNGDLAGRAIYLASGRYEDYYLIVLRNEEDPIRIAKVGKGTTDNGVATHPHFPFVSSTDHIQSSYWGRYGVSEPTQRTLMDWASQM